jgi:hypothetical protein
VIADCQLPIANLITAGRLQKIGNWQSAIGNRQSAIGNRQSAINVS